MHSRNLVRSWILPPRAAAKTWTRLVRDFGSLDPKMESQGGRKQSDQFRGFFWPIRGRIPCEHERFQDKHVARINVYGPCFEFGGPLAEFPSRVARGNFKKALEFSGLAGCRRCLRAAAVSVDL